MLTLADQKTSILWSDQIPKGFDKFFPKSDKNSAKSEEKKEENPFDFKKFTSGGGGSGDNKNSEDKFVTP